MNVRATHVSTRQNLRVSGARPAGKTRSDYLSEEESQALLGNSLAWRMRRLGLPDMTSTDKAAEELATTRVTINDWINAGRCIGLTRPTRGLRLPRWQFEPSIWPHIAKISKALGTKEGWALLAFFETPSAALDGLSPRQMLEQGGLKRVLQVAGVETTSDQ